MRHSIILVFLLIAALSLTGCARQRFEPPASPVPTGSYLPPQAAEGEELLATVESREEAEEIAALYGIELVSCSEHVATFHTDEDLYAVIQRGKDNGWPLLEVNHVISLDDPVSPMSNKGDKMSRPK